MTMEGDTAMMRIDLHHYVHDERADRVVGMLEEALALLRGIKVQEQASKRRESEIMATVAAVKAQADKTLAQITAQKSTIASIVTLVNGTNAQLADLRQQLADAIANGANPVELQAVVDAMAAAEASSLADVDAITTAINANNPAPLPAPPSV